MKTIELVIDESEGMDGVLAISMVEAPAIELDFIALSNQNTAKMQLSRDERQVVLGAALVPDKPIYRIGPNGEEFNIIFSKDTVRRASEIYMRELRNNNVTLEHTEVADGIYLTESWVVENPTMDKSKHLGIDVPEGTWMVAFHVTDPFVWENVKAGKLLGFSIEGMFQRSSAVSNSEELCKKIQDIIDE